LPPLTAIVRSSPALPILTPEKTFIESSTVSVYVELKTIEISKLPPSSVRLLQFASALIKRKLFVGIITSCADVGITPNDQFEPVPQEPPVDPVHVFVCPDAATQRPMRQHNTTARLQGLRAMQKCRVIKSGYLGDVNCPLIPEVCFFMSSTCIDVKVRVTRITSSFSFGC